MRANLASYLDSFRERGAETAYVHRRGYRSIRWSYRGVAEAASQFARELESRAVCPGDRVQIWGENCAEWVIAFLGCLLRGAVVVPMDRIAAPEFAQRVCRQVEARLCVCSREQAKIQVEAPVLALEELAGIVSRHAPTPYPDQGGTRENTVEIVFTSGTTAEPRGVVISHKNILANLEPIESEIGKYLKYERLFHPLGFLNLLPLSHMFGQFLGIFVPQLLGGTVVFHDTLNPSEILSTIKRERISVLVTVPRLLESLRDKIERDEEGAGRLEDFRRQLEAADGEHFIRRWWRFRRIHGRFGWKYWAMISGGAALDQGTEQFWGRLGFAVIQGYGLTETTSIISVNHPMKLGKGSIGKVLPGREIKLDDSGEILVRGDNIAESFYQGRESQPVPGQEGWFRTGDMGELDGEGNLYFKGRKKNVIVTPEGMNVYPEDLEGVLRHQPEIRDCVVVGFEQEGNAEPCAVLIMSEKGLSPEAVVKRANLNLAGYQQIRRWQVWPDEDFPRTSTQKPRISLIRDMIQPRRGEEASEQRPAGTLADLIGRITGRPLARLAPEANLSTDLNLSSIDRVELLSALEDRFQVDLNESRFTAATTVEDLERMLRQPLPQRSDYEYPRWARRGLVATLRIAVYYLLSWPATVLMTRPAVYGKDNLRGVPGPLLIISNHVTQVDIGYILFALPLRLRHRLAVAMLGEMLQEMRHPPRELSLWARCREKLSYVLVVALFNVFPLPQRTGFRESFAYAGECADLGYSIVVFPEGRRTQDGTLSPFQAGVGMLTKNLGLPVVPIRIEGLFELKQTGKKLARPGTVKVVVGPPQRFGPDADPEAIAAELERRMAALTSE